ncbi:MAG TPA: CYTH domain-containing protein [Bacteroidales bacterium]|nr:CYTH domain-containing protein [Bacteroidales bacterium]HPS62464.1 CYTH domain-containing protein [Bacteroidales bacterium]
MVPLEIERKFLVNKELWQATRRSAGELYTQAYLHREAGLTIRVRVVGTTGYLTIKGPQEGCSRPEFEYAVPAEDAEEIIRLFGGSCIRKIRTRIPAGSHTWEVDEFLEENSGLVVAEIELTHPDEAFERPAWLGEEVTHDWRYSNSELSVRPYQRWEGE